MASKRKPTATPPSARATKQLKTKVTTPPPSSRATRQPKTKPDPVLEKCAEVAVALSGASLPGTVLGMLNGSLEHCLPVMKDERHPFQMQVVDWVGEALQGIEGGLQEAVAKVQAKVDGAVEDKAARDAVLTSAEESLAKLREAEGTKQDKVTTDTAIWNEAATKLSDAESAQASGDADLDAATGKLSQFEEMSKNIYEPLKAGTSNIESGLSSLLAFVKRFDFEKSLLNALPSAIKKKPDSRGAFDAVVIGQFEESVAKHISDLQGLLAEGAPAKEARAAAVQSAQAAKDAATGDKEASVAVLAEAKTIRKEGETAFKVAKKAVADFLPELKQAEATLAAAQKELEVFQNGPLASYRELECRCTPLPPKEVEASEAPAVAEASEAPAVAEEMAMAD